MRTVWLLACVLVGGLCACSSQEESPQTRGEDAGVDTGGEVEEDLSPLPGPTEAQGLGLAVTAGVATSPSFRFQYTLAAPVVTGPAASEGFNTTPGLTGAAPAANGE